MSGMGLFVALENTRLEPSFSCDNMCFLMF